MPARSLSNLPADFAAAVGSRVHVDVPAASHKIGSLRIRKHGAALGRTGGVLSDQQCDPRVRTWFGGTVEVRDRCGAGETVEGDRPG